MQSGVTGIIIRLIRVCAYYPEKAIQLGRHIIILNNLLPGGKQDFDLNIGIKTRNQYLAVIQKLS